MRSLRFPPRCRRPGLKTTCAVSAVPHMHCSSTAGRPRTRCPAGWTAADLDDAGWPKEPAAIDHKIPFLISSAATRLVRPGNGVATAAILLDLLRQGQSAAKAVEAQIIPDPSGTP